MGAVTDTYKKGIETLKSYSWLEKLQLLFVIAFSCTLTLDVKTNSLLLFVLLLLLLFSFKPKLFRQNIRPIVIFTSVSLLSLLTLAYSLNMREGQHVLERQVALFVVPILFFSGLSVDRVKFHIIIKLFFLSIVAVSCYLLKCSGEKFLSSHALVKDWFVRENLYHAFSHPVDMHATYLSLYVALAIFIGFYWLLLNDYWWLKVLVFLCILLLVIALTLLSSRVVIFTFAVVLFIVYPFYIGRLKQVLTLLLAGCIILLTFFFVMRESSFFTLRFTEKMDAEIKMTPFLKADSTYNPIYGGEMRADRWYCAIELIKGKPLTGYGTGSEKDVLMQEYKKYNMQNAVMHGYDAHNQYLAYTLKSGILALLLFLVSIIYSIYMSVRTRSFIYLSFMLLFVVTCVTENVLESNKGIFFFAFFNALFYSYCCSKPKEQPANDSTV